MSDAPRLRLLSANLCAISPGGNLRCPVVLGLGGVALTVVLLASAAWRGALPEPRSASGAAPALYAVYGVLRARGAGPGPAGTAAALAASALWAFPVWPLALAWRGLFAFGAVAVSCGPFAQLLNWALMLVRPDLTDNFVEQRLKLFLDHLEASDYDVICLQEMTVSWGQDAFVQRLVAATRDRFPFSCGTSRWPSFPAMMCSTGVLLLSKWPIEASLPFSFRKQALFEFQLIARGGLIARLRHPSAPDSHIDICTVHTTSGLEVLAAEVGQDSSKTQGFANPVGLDQLLEAVELLRVFAERRTGGSRSRPLRIFCGDFNLDSMGGPKHRAALLRFSARARESLGLRDAGPYPETGAGPTFGCVEADGSPSEWLMTKVNDLRCQKRLDFIYADRESVPGTAAVVAMRNDDPSTRHQFQEASDHRGVTVAFPL